jgi:hypothetical protein
MSTTATASEGAADWTERRKRLANGAVCGCHARYSGINLLEQLQPFSTDRAFEVGEARDVPPWSREALHEPRFDGLDDIHEHDRNGAGLALERQSRRRGAPDQHIRPKPDQLLGESLGALDVAAGPTKFDVNVPTLDPAQLGQALPKSRHLRLTAGIVLYEARQHPDAPQALALLGAHREWPKGRRSDRTPEKDEIAAVHSITSPARRSSATETAGPGA